MVRGPVYGVDVAGVLVAVWEAPRLVCPAVVLEHEGAAGVVALDFGVIKLDGRRDRGSRLGKS